MFQRRFVILFFGPLVRTRKSSYLKLTKGNTKEKVTKEKSTCLNLHQVKFAPSNRAVPAFGICRGGGSSFDREKKSISGSRSL